MAQNIEVQRLAYDVNQPLALVPVMPGHNITPFGPHEIFYFDRMSDTRPNTMNLGSHRVVQIEGIHTDPARMAAVGVLLAHAYLSDVLTTTYPPGEQGDITDYHIAQEGVNYLVLMQDISKSLLIKVIRVLYRPWSYEMGLPTPFIISPSIHKRLISFSQWRLTHLGESMHGVMMDSPMVWELFMGSPFIGLCPVALFNYFQGMSQMSRFD